MDTNIASYIIKRRSPAIQAKLSEIPPSHVCVSAITRAELLYGRKRLPPTHRLHLAVKRFLKLVQTLSWDAEAADYYADICHQLVSPSQPIGELDMMIAAHSLSAGAMLVTNNARHDSRIEAPLTLANWADSDNKASDPCACPAVRDGPRHRLDRLEQRDTDFD